MAAIVKRRLLSLGSPSTVVSSFLASLLTTRGQIIRRGASGPEALAAKTADTFVGGDGTDVTTRTAAQVRTSLGISYANYTPTVAFATPGTSSFSYATQLGRYLIVGNYAFASFTVRFTPTIGTGSGSFRISLPFTSVTGDGQGPIGYMSSQFTWPASKTFIQTYIPLGSISYCVLTGFQTAANPVDLTASNLTDGVQHLITASIQSFTS